MKCDYCENELTETIVHNYVHGALKSLPGFECHYCYAIYDQNGTVLEEPMDARYTEPSVEHDERGAYTWMYGHFGGGDPRDFQPDMELCTPEEIERWKADVARAEAGENVIAPPAGEWVTPTMHILAPKYGVGTYKLRFDDDDAAPSDGAER